MEEYYNWSVKSPCDGCKYQSSALCLMIQRCNRARIISNIHPNKKPRAYWLRAKARYGKENIEKLK